MTIRDDNNTFTTAFEDINERFIWNDNQSITIGGRVKSQADSSRYQIESEMLLTNTNFILLNAILTNFNEELFYTPTRALFGKTAIEEIKVTAKAPQIKSRTTCDSTSI